MHIIRYSLVCLFFVLFPVVGKSPLLLIKIPTRARPQQFFTALDLFYKRLSGNIEYHFLITCDTDDQTMNTTEVIERLQNYPHLSYSFSNNHSKIEAYNRDLEKHNFDILLAVSDDMEPLVQGYDQIIADAMNAHFPDSDGVLNFNDGYTHNRCNTLPIVGKKFFDHCGYLYNPLYRSECCDEELTMVSRILNKEYVCSTVIIRHNHPTWTHGSYDELYKKNIKIGKTDVRTFKERRKKNFDLSQEEIDHATTKEWSILICASVKQTKLSNRLHQKLTHQIAAQGLENKVEIIFCDDHTEYSTSDQRNWLLKKSTGKYISFIDNTDNVPDDYIKTGYRSLKSNPDWVNLKKIIQHKKSNPLTHSKKHKNYRPHKIKGNYLQSFSYGNLIRRCIAIQFLFSERDGGRTWARKIVNTGLLKKRQSLNPHSLGKNPPVFVKISDFVLRTSTDKPSGDPNTSLR